MHRPRPPAGVDGAFGVAGLRCGRSPWLVPLAAREAAESDQPDQGDDQPDPEAPDDHQHDPDDHEDASQRNSADAGSSVCPAVHLLLRSWFLDECFVPTATRGTAELLRFRHLLAWPLTGDFGERGAAAVVDEAFGQAEDRALDRERGDQLRPGEFAVLGLRRLLVVYQPPDLFEDLLADQPRDQPEDDADRGEDDLHCRPPPSPPPEFLPAMAAAAAARERPTAAIRFGQRRFGCVRPEASARAPSRRLSAPRCRFLRA